MFSTVQRQPRLCWLLATVASLLFVFAFTAQAEAKSKSKKRVKREAVATLSLANTTVAPGVSDSATGRNFAKRGSYVLKLGGTKVASGRTSSRGTFKTAFTVPAISLGAHTATATVAAVSASVRITVVAPAPVPVPEPVPVPPSAPPPAPDPPAADHWKPPSTTTWQYQLTGTIDQTVPVSFVIVDLFDTSNAVVDSLKAAGKDVGCYFSAGSYEDWRPDKDAFPAEVLGKSNGWPGERWLDIRRLDILGPIMEARMDACKANGYVAIDPDNVDGYTNDTGFPLTAADQERYNKFLADAAHARGLAVGLKNDIDQADDLVTSFDFAVNEQCAQYKECDTLTPFVVHGKPVFEVEYSLATDQFCAKSLALGFMPMRKKLSLNAWMEPCWT